MKEKLLRLPEVLRRTGFGRSHIYNLINRGEFPKQIQISSGAVAWLESEFETWMDKKIQPGRGRASSGKLQAGRALAA